MQLIPPVGFDNPLPLSLSKGGLEALGPSLHAQELGDLLCVLKGLPKDWTQRALQGLATFTPKLNVQERSEIHLWRKRVRLGRCCAADAELAIKETCNNSWHRQRRVFEACQAWTLYWVRAVAWFEILRDSTGAQDRHSADAAHSLAAMPIDVARKKVDKLRSEYRRRRGRKSYKSDPISDYILTLRFHMQRDRRIRRESTRSHKRFSGARPN